MLDLRMLLFYCFYCCFIFKYREAVCMAAEWVKEAALHIIVSRATSMHLYFLFSMSSYHSDCKVRKYISENFFCQHASGSESTKQKPQNLKEAETIILRPVRIMRDFQQMRCFAAPSDALARVHLCTVGCTH